MTNIYDDHSNAFRAVEAWVVLEGKDVVARVAFKHSASNLRVACYFHVLGIPMVKGIANGGGYDRHSAAACEGACKTLAECSKGDFTDALISRAKRMKDAIYANDGAHWYDALRGAGFTCHQAV